MSDEPAPEPGQELGQSLTEASREMENAQLHLDDLKRWSRMASCAVVLGLLSTIVLTTLAVLVNQQLGIVAVVTAVMVVLGVVLFCYVNVAEVFVSQGKDTGGYPNGYHTTRMRRARVRKAHAVDRYERLVAKELGMP
jgi:hypothetical protein